MSEQVRRYKVWEADLVLPDDSEVVRASDYDTLQAEFERMRELSDALESIIESQAVVISSLRAILAAIKAQEPVAVLRYSRNAAGLENEMPSVISCNDFPDGEYKVYALPVVSQQQDQRLDGSPAQKAYWAGFEAARTKLHGTNIRSAWNEYKTLPSFPAVTPQLTTEPATAS